MYITVSCFASANVVDITIIPAVMSAKPYFINTEAYRERLENEQLINRREKLKSLIGICTVSKQNFCPPFCLLNHLFDR